jgi:hypothetical protein
MIDPETIPADNLPPIWSPVQWELTPQDRIREIEEQARASLLVAADPPEAMLRIALGETGIERAFDPPRGYDPELQGEWDESLVTFQFKRPMRLEKVDRRPDSLYAEYNCGDLGWWAVEFLPERVVIERL